MAVRIRVVIGVIDTGSGDIYILDRRHFREQLTLSDDCTQADIKQAARTVIKTLEDNGVITDVSPEEQLQFEGCEDIIKGVQRIFMVLRAHITTGGTQFVAADTMGPSDRTHILHDKFINAMRRWAKQTM